MRSRSQLIEYTFTRWTPFICFLTLSSLLVGCSGVAPVATDATQPPAEIAYIEVPSEPEPLPEDPVPVFEPDWPDAPAGESSPEQWEELNQLALEHLARRELHQARDAIFQLQALAAGPQPAAEDSLYLEHRRSVNRRIGLLAALLAEQEAFGGDPALADSVLAAGYLTSTGLGLPDSLVPATGTELSPFQADLLKVNHEKVDRWLDYFTGRGRRHFQLWLERAAVIGPSITEILVDEGLPTELLYLSMIESGLNPRARSNVGAVGAWQFMPGTARGYGLAMDWWVDERRDLERSTRAACRYMQRLHDEFGDWALVLASYNGGEGRVRRQLRDNGHTNFWDYRLPRQTVEYVPKFIAAARIGTDPEAFGFEVPGLPHAPTEVLTVSDATDLALIASCADLPEKQVYDLNPALLRRATPPGRKDYPVYLPEGTAARARANLRKVPATKRLTWRKHEVQRGETLGHIAQQWGTTVRGIQEANSLGRSTLIRPGDQLLIPMPAELQALARKRAEAAGRYVPPAGHEKVTYRVKSGDTLGAIARRLGVSVNHLKRVNGIKNPRRLRIGQRLAAYRPPSNS